MSLTKFTIQDRRNIQKALELPAKELNDGSYLYERLEQLEEWDRQNNIDRSGCVKTLALDILALCDRIDQQWQNVDYGVTELAESIKSDTSRRVKYDTNRGIDLGLQKLKLDKQLKLKCELNWIAQNRICLG